MTDRASSSRFKAPLLASAAMAIALLGILTVQHLRHGWPFSLHHIAPAMASSAKPVSTGPEVPGDARVPVELDSQRMAQVGIALERVRIETIGAPLRVTATVVPDEGRIAHLHTRISGWLEELHVSTTGQNVRAGQPLASIFSQELYASQVEYLGVRKNVGNAPASAILDGARTRLGVLGMSEPEIREIERTGHARRLVTLVAPRSGAVLRRPVAVGSAVDPSTEIVTIADLSRVWVIAEVPEGEAAGIRAGAAATLEFPAAAPIPGRVEFVSPTMSERTRTLKVRFSVENAGGALRPGLYGTAEFSTTPRDALTVPRDAVVDAGDRQHVFVATAPGLLEPRTVVLGARTADRVEIRSGLAVGDEIVSAGVFLIDSESRLRASGNASTHAHGAQKAPDEPQHTGH